MAEEVKLFGAWGSPSTRRVEIALKLKGVKYEYIEEDLKNKSPLLLTYNPVHKKVPVLLHNGQPIAESLIILEYIDDTWQQQGPPILPKDPYQRSKARFWAKFLDDKFAPQIWKACWGEGEEREKGIEEATESLKLLENEIKGKKLFGGDNLGLVDIVAHFMAYWSEILQQLLGLDFFTREKYPNLFNWGDEFCNCSFVKENLPPKHELVLIFKGLTNSYTSSA
ncbi:hypothetical protein MIMGU_mgv1a013321mg [Erythranthe guttata]|uniref:glutathione transferase n=1 Tax=Erythranthe guttata TaxID=4155 RepID=A0A022QH88_ERYGU|nr:PREDICTED: glutathione S-transferase U8-like [Erythranthe guttata]EYU26623.1 hypothetical protein MIMGU_mgv1a013321mg [Erythranthe guttata]|eukprot:XP_012850392.1 PREDICTED: glutathione S-transferase U8-like [Erythranthe guttata]